jgi:hypothetical protein
MRLTSSVPVGRRRYAGAPDSTKDRRSKTARARSDRLDKLGGGSANGIYDRRAMDPDGMSQHSIEEQRRCRS